MKILNYFFLLLILMPFINAELTEQYIDKTIQAQNDYFKLALDNRDKNIESKINGQIEAFKTQLDTNVSLYALKLGLIIAGCIVFSGIIVISLNMYLNKLYNDIQKKKNIILRRQIDGLQK